MGKLINLIGQQFGYYTILKRVENSSNNRRARYLCRCKCGIEKEVDGGALRNGHTQSCGCIKKGKPRKAFQNLTGRVFGSLSVINYWGDNKWECECICGNHKIITRHNLISGHTKSCGCSRKGKQN